ncbi:MAG: alanyl-tRNA editing protein [Syntrophales bacterium]|nr:alanyl-tRNA editing protein [Syntrophales bacterium]
MAVGKAFWEDPYRTELATVVAGVRGGDITLERTIFYAFSGGQEGDTGTIAGFPVREARKEGREIVYTIEGPHELKAGDAVTVRIDWPRRYSLMRLHFAAEIVLELMYQKYPGVRKVGAHISEQKARLDFAWEGNISETFPVIEEGFREIVSADHAITSAFSDPEDEVRYWEIEGFARVSCGGTHLKRTGEVGAVTLRRNNIGKGKERVEITLSA